MNKDIEGYLRKATRGLWGQKRKEVEEELMAHIDGRCNTHLIAGLDEETAVQKALSELGQPYRVSAGMMRLHTAPTLMALATAISLIVLTVFALLTSSVAQSVSGTFYWPSEACVTAIKEGKVSGDILQDYLSERTDDNCASADNSLWLDFEALRPILEAAGIETKDVASGVILLFPGGERITVFLGSRTDYVVDENNKQIPTEPHYFDLWELVITVSQKPEIPLKIEGWDNPTITIGEASFQIGTIEQPFQGDDFYDNYLDRILFNLIKQGQYPNEFGVIDMVKPRIERLAQGREFYGDSWDENYVATTEFVLDTQSTSDVYGVVVVLDLENPLVHQPADYNEQPGLDASFYTVLAQTNPDGSLSLELPANESVKFVDAFSPSFEPGEAMLFELAADAGSWFKVVTPEQIRLE